MIPQYGLGPPGPAAGAPALGAVPKGIPPAAANKNGPPPAKGLPGTKGPPQLQGGPPNGSPQFGKPGPPGKPFGKAGPPPGKKGYPPGKDGGKIGAPPPAAPGAKIGKLGGSGKDGPAFGMAPGGKGGLAPGAPPPAGKQVGGKPGKPGPFGGKGGKGGPPGSKNNPNNIPLGAGGGKDAGFGPPPASAELAGGKPGPPAGAPFGGKDQGKPQHGQFPGGKDSKQNGPPSQRSGPPNVGVEQRIIVGGKGHDSFSGGGPPTQAPPLTQHIIRHDKNGTKTVVIQQQDGGPPQARAPPGAPPNTTINGNQIVHQVVQHAGLPATQRPAPANLVGAPPTGGPPGAPSGPHHTVTVVSQLPPGATVVSGPPPGFKGGQVIQVQQPGGAAPPPQQSGPPHQQPGGLPPGAVVTKGSPSGPVPVIGKGGKPEPPPGYTLEIRRNPDGSEVHTMRPLDTSGGKGGLPPAPPQQQQQQQIGIQLGGQQPQPGAYNVQQQQGGPGAPGAGPAPQGGLTHQGGKGGFLAPAGQNGANIHVVSGGHPAGSSVIVGGPLPHAGPPGQHQILTTTQPSLSGNGGIPQHQIVEHQPLQHQVGNAPPLQQHQQHHISTSSYPSAGLPTTPSGGQPPPSTLMMNTSSQHPQQHHGAPPNNSMGNKPQYPNMGTSGPPHQSSASSSHPQGAPAYPPHQPQQMSQHPPVYQQHYPSSFVNDMHNGVADATQPKDRGSPPTTYLNADIPEKPDRNDFASRKPEVYDFFRTRNVFQSKDAPGLWDLALWDGMCRDKHVGDFIECLEAWLARVMGEKPYHLHKFCLRGNELKDASIKIIMEQLIKLEVRLDILDLSQNNIEAEGASKIADYIWSSDPVQVLHLDHNKLQHDDVNAVLRACYNHNSYPIRNANQVPIPLRLGIVGNPIVDDLKVGDLLNQIRKQGGKERVWFCNSPEDLGEKEWVKHKSRLENCYLAVHMPAAFEGADDRTRGRKKDRKKRMRSHSDNENLQDYNGVDAGHGQHHQHHDGHSDGSDDGGRTKRHRVAEDF
ncbi:unnamed protein product [Amoebophrya sp. A25]|nr:unnamed protein product [Amoebophrya sp. A25]|eukprot:GSA25T00011734001.1